MAHMAIGKKVLPFFFPAHTYASLEWKHLRMHPTNTPNVRLTAAHVPLVPWAATSNLPEVH